ncbi:hypothetical protein GQ53DRAFT_757128 [Thozetella sp. PMI_491]|nr:hypothetical protein GQ53DRAFT_757128 [Thozetella sp. PMI_491]
MLFQSLVPALFLNVTAKLPVTVGTLPTGSTLTYVDVIDGVMTSSPGFSPAISARVVRGGDYLSVDPSANFLRLDIDVLCQTDDNPPDFVRVQATGIEGNTPEVAALVGGQRDVPPAKWGDFTSVASWTISAGNNKYSDLQNSLFVGSASLRVGTVNGTFFVGFQIAQVLNVQTDLHI